MLPLPTARQMSRRPSVLQPPNYAQPQRQPQTAAMDRSLRMSYGQLTAQGRPHQQRTRRADFENTPPQYEMDDDVEEVDMDM